MKNFCTPILARSQETRKSSTGKRGFNQSSLFPGNQSSQTPILSVEPVPKRLAIAVGRYYITSRQGDRFWHYPIQFEPLEIDRILPRLRKLNWALDTDGVPIDVGAIHGAVKQAIDGGLV